MFILSQIIKKPFFYFKPMEFDDPHLSDFDIKALSLVDRFMKDPSHDAFHAYKVLKNAMFILKHERKDANMRIVRAAAILHDMFDEKYDRDNLSSIAINFLKRNGFSDDEIDEIVRICNSISFRKGSPEPKTIEEAIVRDADRLEAIGAIGIARAFTYGGERRRPIYSKGGDSTINHFYDKLIHLKDLMATQTGKLLAEKRHAFLLLFLNQFFYEMSYDLVQKRRED